jgi:hypothetical protein
LRSDYQGARCPQEPANAVANFLACHFPFRWRRIETSREVFCGRYGSAV